MLSIGPAATSFGVALLAVGGPFVAVGVTTHMDRENSFCAIRVNKTVSCWSYGG